jgi:hypothetical protein
VKFSFLYSCIFSSANKIYLVFCSLAFLRGRKSEHNATCRQSRKLSHTMSCRIFDNVRGERKRWLFGKATSHVLV